jgi:hypothetical protein
MQYIIDKKDATKFNAIKNYVELQSEKLRGITVCQFRIIESCVVDLLESKTTSTIDNKVSEIFGKYKFTVTVEGIGWRITV